MHCWAHRKRCWEGCIPRPIPAAHILSDICCWQQVPWHLHMRQCRSPLWSCLSHRGAIQASCSASRITTCAQACNDTSCYSSPSTCHAVMPACIWIMIPGSEGQRMCPTAPAFRPSHSIHAVQGYTFGLGMWHLQIAAAMWPADAASVGGSVLCCVVWTPVPSQVALTEHNGCIMDCFTSVALRLSPICLQVPLLAIPREAASDATG